MKTSQATSTGAMIQAGANGSNVFASHAARVIAALSADVRAPLTPRILATASGLDIQEVIAVYRNPEFGDILLDNARSRWGLLLERATTAVENVLNDPEASHTLKLRAAKMVTDSYVQLTAAQQRHEKSEAAAQAQEVIRDVLARIKKPEITVEQQIAKLQEKADESVG